MAIIPANEKVFMVSNDTNTTYGGSAALQAMNQWYTMQDISDSVVVTAPYKVYTALLTQSGTDAPVATVLENTFNETFTFTRMGPGMYNIVSANNAFTTGKTFVIMQAITTFTSGNPVLNQYYNDETVPHPGYIQIMTRDTSFNLAEATYALPNIIPIEIRVYN